MTAARDPHFTEYVLSGSDEAFARLVEAHIGMVHSTARRMLGDRGDAAADVAQMVFSRLTRKARTPPPAAGGECLAAQTCLAGLFSFLTVMSGIKTLTASVLPGMAAGGI